MKVVVLLLIAALCLASVLAVHELPMEHRKRTPREAQMLIEYMTRGPMMTRVNKLLSKIFPSALTPNIYAYPEVKILNYLDAQYYGYTLFHADKSTLELLLNPSELSSILDLPIFGCPPRSADFPLLAIFTNTSTPPRAQPMSITEPTSTLPTDQELSPVSSVRTRPGLQVWRLKSPSLPRLPNFTESASWLQSSTASWEWPGLLFQ